MMRLAALFAVTVALSPSAQAAETATFLRAPATHTAPGWKLAAQYDLKLHLPEGRGLARLLLDAGVGKDDAAAAARVAAGHLGDGDGGCVATVSIERSSSGGFEVARIMLTTQRERTVIERRGAELAIASSAATNRTLRLT